MWMVYSKQGRESRLGVDSVWRERQTNELRERRGWGTVCMRKEFSPGRESEQKEKVYCLSTVRKGEFRTGVYCARTERETDE